MTIFVSIASYRDKELVPTVQDCLAKAAHPGELRIVVCWQHLGDEDISAISDLPQVDILEFDARQSRGACWARDKIFQAYGDEEWLLQVDSHTRFAQDWDVRMIAAALSTGSEKPILSTYPPRYDPHEEFTGEGVATELTIHQWSEFGVPMYGQRMLPHAGPDVPPMPGLFLGAGFLFAPGSFAREVPYDPDIYFHGEEITLTMRAFTWGYDLFHPTEVYVWHYYIREDNPRHWTDHTGGNESPDWGDLERLSRRHVLYIMRFPPEGGVGVGPVRTLQSWLEHTGCDFVRRKWTEPQPPELVFI